MKLKEVSWRTLLVVTESRPYEVIHLFVFVRLGQFDSLVAHAPELNVYQLG